MTVAELIELLKQMPQDLEVKYFDSSWGMFYGVNPPIVMTKDDDNTYSSYLDEGETIVSI